MPQAKQFAYAEHLTVHFLKRTSILSVVFEFINYMYGHVPNTIQEFCPRKPIRNPSHSHSKVAMISSSFRGLKLYM